MKKFTLLLIPIIFSCTSNETQAKDDIISECEAVYVVLTKENNKYCEYISEKLNESVISTDNGDIKRYDSLTSAYVKLLDSIGAAIKLNSSMILFKDEFDYSPLGKNFIFRTKVYKQAIEEFADDENFKKRLNLVLNTNDVAIKQGDIANNNENNVRTLNTVYVKYLDYYYKGFTANQCLAFISSKKRNLLEMEMEYILSHD